jgi:hypothetical protein
MYIICLLSTYLCVCVHACMYLMKIYFAGFYFPQRKESFDDFKRMKSLDFFLFFVQYYRFDVAAHWRHAKDATSVCVCVCVCLCLCLFVCVCVCVCVLGGVHLKHSQFKLVSLVSILPYMCPIYYDICVLVLIEALLVGGFLYTCPPPIGGCVYATLFCVIELY